MEQHFTGGFTLNTSANSEFNLAAMYAPSSSVTGPNPLSGVTPDQNVKIEMSQWELEASWAWKY
jgi:long-chain fatty acid transport protein